MFGGRGGTNGQPSFSSQRSKVTTQRPFQRYAISPVRNNRQSRSPVTLYANIVNARRERDDNYNRNEWRKRSSNSPLSHRQVNTYNQRRSRSRSFEQVPNFYQRGGNMSRSHSQSPSRNRHAHRGSRTPLKMWRQQRFSSPQRGYQSRSPLSAGLPRRDSYIVSRRSHSRSGSNMELASNGSSPNDQMFRSTFRTTESKKNKKNKVASSKDIKKDSSPDVIEIDYRGYRVRNAPDVYSNDSRRKSRWDNDQSTMPIPSTKEILEKQGVPNPDEALKRIANLPTMDSRFKPQMNDDDAVKEQLRLLEQQQRFEKLKVDIKQKNMIPTSTIVSPMTASNTSITTNSSNFLPANVSFPPPGFPNFGAQLPGGILPPPVGLTSNFTGPPPNVPLSFGVPPAGFNSAAPGNGIVTPMPTNFTAPPPMGVIPPASASLPISMIPPHILNIPPNVAGQNISSLPSIGPTPGHQPQLDQLMDSTEVMFRARADIYRRDLSEIRSIPELMKYMWSQGFDPISPDDPPLLFNEVLKEREGILGASALYQIICFGYPELETYYCGMCNHWTTVSEMFNHLIASMHRMNFLARNYKLFHKKAAEEYQDLAKRDEFLDFICKRVWKIDGSGQCVNRMRCILNIDAIKQVWPNYFEYVDNSWKMLGTKDAIEDMLESDQLRNSQLDDQAVILSHNQSDTQMYGITSKSKIMIKPSLNTVLNRNSIGELERISERGRCSSRERLRSRSRSYGRSRKRSRSRRRSRSSSRKRECRRRSRSNSLRRSSSKRDDKREWERKASEFITQINNDGIKSAFNSVSTSAFKSANDDYQTSRGSIRRKQNVEAEQEQIRLTRKALAVLVELQQMHNETKSIKKSMIYAIAGEMGMDEEAVNQSKILKQGLENMNIVNDLDGQQKAVSLEALGMSTSDLKKLLSSVSTVSKVDDPSMVYPEVGTESKLANNIRVAIRETQQKMNDPNNAHMNSELQRRLDHLEMKLSQELGVDPVRRVPLGAVPSQSRPYTAGVTNQSLLPGAWRALAARDNSAIDQRTTMRSRRDQEEKSSTLADEQKFDADKVEREWTEYFMKDPSKIEDLNNSNDKHTEAQYDSYYGPGTYIAFCAARRRAAINARRALTAPRAQSKSYFEDFSV